MDKPEEKLLGIIKSNNDYIKGNSKPGKNFETILKLSQTYITNAFLYMLLNRLYRSKVKFYSNKHLDECSKSINLFFLIWDNILEKSDYYELKHKSPKFYKQIPNQESIKNFYRMGLAIDQITKLSKETRNIQMLIDFKKRNLLLVIALLDIKKVFVEIEPSYPDSSLYQQFLLLVKKETLEYADVELSRQFSVNISLRNIKSLRSLISFGKYLNHFLNNFNDPETNKDLENKINSWKKYLLKIEKFQKKN